MENGGDHGGDGSERDLREMLRGQRGTEAAVLHAHLDGDRAAQALATSGELREKVAQEEPNGVQQEHGEETFGSRNTAAKSENRRVSPMPSITTPSAMEIQGRNTVHASGCPHAHAQPISSQSGNPAVNIPDTFAKRIEQDHSPIDRAVEKSPPGYGQAIELGKK